MKRMMMTMAMVVMMISSVSAKNMSNRPTFGKQPTCTCCKHGDKRGDKHGDCKQDKRQSKPAPAFGGNRGAFGSNRENKPVTLPAPKGQRPVEIGRPQNAPQSPSVDKGTNKPNRGRATNSSNRSFGNNSTNNSFGNMKR